MGNPVPIRVWGCKLANQNQPCPPLEVSNNVHLELFFNSTRLTRPAEHFGSLNKMPLGALPYSLPPTKISAIRPDGGQVSMIDVVVLRKFPFLFKERDTATGNTVTRGLSEESARQDQVSRIQERELESLFSKFERESNQDFDVLGAREKAVNEIREKYARGRVDGVCTLLVIDTFAVLYSIAGSKRGVPFYDSSIALVSLNNFSEDQSHSINTGCRLQVSGLKPLQAGGRMRLYSSFRSRTEILNTRCDFGNDDGKDVVSMLTPLAITNAAKKDSTIKQKYSSCGFPWRALPKTWIANSFIDFAGIPIWCSDIRTEHSNYRSQESLYFDVIFAILTEHNSPAQDRNQEVPEPDTYLLQLNVKVPKDCQEKDAIIEKIHASLTTNPKLTMIENVIFVPNGRMLFCRADLLQMRFSAWRNTTTRPKLTAKSSHAVSSDQYEESLPKWASGQDDECLARLASQACYFCGGGNVLFAATTADTEMALLPIAR